MSVSVQDTDHGFNSLRKSLHDLKDGSIRIGIQGNEAAEEHDDKSGLSVATIGYFQEFGLGVPQRSFLRDWLVEEEDEVKDVMEAVIKGIIGNKYSADTGLERAGAAFVGMVQVRIAEGIDPPNADSTVARKGSSTPLIEFGLLRSSITYRVVWQDE